MARVTWIARKSTHRLHSPGDVVVYFVVAVSIGVSGNVASERSNGHRRPDGLVPTSCGVPLEAERALRLALEGHLNGHCGWGFALRREYASPPQTLTPMQSSWNMCRHSLRR